MNDLIKNTTSARPTSAPRPWRMALLIPLLMAILLIIPLITTAQQPAPKNADTTTVHLPDGSTALAHQENPADPNSDYRILPTPPVENTPVENTTTEKDSTHTTSSAAETAFVPESTFQWYLFVFGLLAQITFMSRFFVQWLVSERAKKSIIPNAFWWLSLAGSTMLFTYFTLRHDPIGMFGQCTGWLIYSRNLYFIYRSHHAI